MKKLNYILCLFNTAFFAFLILNGCTYFTSQQKDLREVGLAQSAPLRLNLIFPKIAPGDSVEVGALTDSVFLYGNVSDPTGELIVEGIHFPIHPGGGWLAYVPLDSVKDYSSEVFGDAGSASSVTIIYRSASYERELKSQIPIPGHTGLPDEQVIQRRLWFFQPTPKPIYPVVTEPFDARLEVTNTSAKIRCGMPGTYYLFPPLGTILKATGVRKTGHTFYQVPLGAGEIGWIEDVEVKVSPGQPGAKESVIYSVVCETESGSTPHAGTHGATRREVTHIRIPLREKIPFRVQRVSDERLELTLYGAVSWTDLIIQPASSRVVDEVRWSQIDPTTYRLTAFLHPQWFWGWEIDYNEKRELVWTICQAPEIQRREFAGITIVLDPGHGGENLGAIGPTGLLEKDANLDLCREVEAELQDAGATVYLTRSHDEELSLEQRVEFANQVKADMFISMHYNSLPQGKNPFCKHGTSVHYNHRHSKELAEILLEEITCTIEWEGEGLRYQDLAIPRNTSCPTVLIENGFLLHPEEEALAKERDFQRAVAKGIRKGIKRYLESIRTNQRG